MTHPCPPNASQTPPSFRSRLLRRLFQDANDRGLFQDPEEAVDEDGPNEHAAEQHPLADPRDDVLARAGLEADLRQEEARIRFDVLREAYLERVGRR